MTDCAANSHGLVFSISPAKKQPKSKKDDEDEENILTLAPFTKPPKINFGQLKINESVQRSVLIINPQQFDVDLIVTNNELNINNIQLKIEKSKNVNLKITWRPEKPGNHKFVILFEVTNSARLKFLVHAFGVCIKPEEKKPIRKPLNMLQPLRKKTEKAPVQKKETTVSTKYKTTTTTTTTIYKKSTGSKSKFDETVVIEKKGNKENSNHLGITIEAVTETRKDTESRSLKNIYDDSFTEPKALDSTPKYTEIKTPTQPTSKVQLTPKLSDFIKPPSYSSDQSPSLVTSMTKITRIAATKYVDISIDQENPINSKTVIDEGPKTPHFPLKFNSQFYESVPFDQYLLEPDSNRMNTPKLDKNFLYKEDYADAFLVEKYAIICQKKWRYKVFRRKLREIKLKMKTERISQLLAGSKGLALEFELLNKKQDELVTQQQMEKQRKDKLLLEMNRQEQERKQKLLKCIILCQRAIRMKRFRIFFRKYKQKMLDKSAVLIQRKWRLIRFRRCLRMLKLEDQLRMEQKMKINKCTILCQRWFRYKKFRRCLKILVEKKKNLERQIEAVCVLQKSWRMLRFRQQMTKYRSAALTIQLWYRNCIRPKNNFLLLRKCTLKIQAIYRQKVAKRTAAVLIIQSNFKAYIERKKFIQIKKSAIKIESWYLTKLDRIKFLKLKRSIPHIQFRSRQLILKHNKAAMTIQRAYCYYKFRRQMKIYRECAQKIQRWSRSMKFRYDYLEYKRTVIKSVVVIQQNWRIYLAKRERTRQLSAVLIQRIWRGYWTRKNFETLREKRLEEIRIEHELTFLNECAIKIQSAWRGFRVRRATTQVLFSIRSRLSFYQINTSSASSTLGSRIRNVLKILNYPSVPIQQIILALTDLNKVTRLSPECCLFFTHEGAIEILYTLIMSCNRSVPHMDLVKLCLQILINLGKYSQTVEYILSPAGSCLLLLNLLQAYQSSNPNIFMYTCIIFILLSQQEPIKEFILRQENLVLKITGIHSILKRRANFSRDRQTSKGCLNNKDQLNSTLNIGLNCGAKKSLVLSFSFMPDWCLAKKNSIELVEPIGALEYMMKSLGISIETCKGNTLSSKTPKKSLSSSAIDKSGKKSTIKAKPAPIPHLTKQSTKQLFKESHEPAANSVYRMENVSLEKICDPEYDEDHFSITSNESYRSVSSVTTVKSISNLDTELPKLNSTLVSSNNFRKIAGMKKSESVNFHECT